jgi:hypothetical protein
VPRREAAEGEIMKAWIAAIVAKGATWVVHLAVGWVKGETPEYAMRMRRRTKAKILAQKARAIETVTEADDIPPLAADVYMGLDTMRQAQAKIAEIFKIVNRPELPESPWMYAIVQDLRDTAQAAIRILDEEGDDEE